MAAVLTNAGKNDMAAIVFRGVAPPTNFFLYYITNAVAPSPDTNTLSELTQIADGNGFTNPISVARNSTDWDSLVENDTLDQAELQMKDQVTTASGGPVPASGGGIAYAVLTDDNVTEGSRRVWAYWTVDAVTPVVISDTQTFTLQNAQINFKDAA